MAVNDCNLSGTASADFRSLHPSQSKISFETGVFIFLPGTEGVLCKVCFYGAYRRAVNITRHSPVSWVKGKVGCLYVDFG